MQKKRLPQPKQLGDAVLLVARLGGYLGRATDPPPGHQIMWHGYAQLQTLCEGFCLNTKNSC
ncbi:IS4 family transposase [Candidatus Accumulibacter sp. ACC003]|uniref:IS4 family transposase n=1 Tax=Candidatus Accumulibacter sp. ACC003 TaxID=2823334 RepID=UPI0025C5E56C|nr:IS4 family transposase [Candidatus Accumulibacter sp. ACC003]